MHLYEYIPKQCQVELSKKSKKTELERKSQDQFICFSGDFRDGVGFHIKISENISAACSGVVDLKLINRRSDYGKLNVKMENMFAKKDIQWRCKINLKFNRRVEQLDVDLNSEQGKNSKLFMDILWKS